MRIYLDHNATTPLRDEVVAAMVQVLQDEFGNPSSTHEEGTRARGLVDRAREQVASCLGARADEVSFTAGATEANNTVLCGMLASSSGRHLVTSAVEHPSVIEPADALEAAGVRVTRLGVDAEGMIDPEAYDAALAEGADLVSLIWANNETGVVQPLAILAERARERGVPVHVDATQAVGKLPIDLKALPVDYLSCSAHKLNGPKGTGCLIARSGARLEPLLRGGPQERRLRGGTENVAGIVGFGIACELAERELPERGERMSSLRDRLWHGIQAKLSRVRRNGSAQHVLPNTLNVEIGDCAGELLLQALDLEGVAASAGAACHSGSIHPSHVLAAMGRSPGQCRASLRLSVGHGVDEGQIDRAVQLLAELVPRVREAGLT